MVHNKFNEQNAELARHVALINQHLSKFTDPEDPVMRASSRVADEEIKKGPRFAEVGEVQYIDIECVRGNQIDVFKGRMIESSKVMGAQGLAFEGLGVVIDLSHKKSFEDSMDLLRDRIMHDVQKPDVTSGTRSAYTL